MEPETFWLIVGFGGQAFFSARFLIQWIATERAQRSTIPRAFWFLSLGGALMLLTYAIYREDPVFVVGQSAGMFVYGRNLWFIYRRETDPEP